MRLYKQELKRLLLTTMTRVVFIIAIVFSILLALLASEFSDADYPDDDGNIVQLHGVESIKFIEKASAGGNGEVTADRLKEALQKYQDLYHEYGSEPLKTSNFPLDIYWE